MRFIRQNRFGILLSLLTLSACALRLFVAQADPFLHDWDERFHALVARNMMHHPFQPMLRAHPVVDYDRFAWCCNHIWLHKQPFFLWQMALSMKIFGVSELAMRLPSVLMGTLMIPVLYRISYLLTNNKIVSLIAAGFLAFSQFHLEMTSGIKGMDHNDVALGFYVLLSMWTYAEYLRSGKWYWAAGTGLFCGAAILIKWLLGLFIFLGWGINLVIGLVRKNIPLVQLFHFILALAVCCAVFLPWQFYIMQQWPAEALYAYEFNRRHITEALDGHTGTVWYYFEHSHDLFGPWLAVLVLPGMVLSFRKKEMHKTLLVAVVSGILFVFLFFSLIVRTKHDAYIFFIVPLCAILMALVIYELIRRIPWYLQLPVLFFFAWISLGPMKFRWYYSNENGRRHWKIHNTGVYKKLRLPPQYKVVMNLPQHQDVELMFYRNELTAYQFCLSEEELRVLAARKVPLAVFATHGRYVVPEYVKRYPYLYVIQQQLVAE